MTGHGSGPPRDTVPFTRATLPPIALRLIGVESVMSAAGKGVVPPARKEGLRPDYPLIPVFALWTLLPALRSGRRPIAFENLALRH
jgi:hypothetical protein